MKIKAHDRNNYGPEHKELDEKVDAAHEHDKKHHIELKEKKDAALKKAKTLEHATGHETPTAPSVDAVYDDHQNKDFHRQTVPPPHDVVHAKEIGDKSALRDQIAAERSGYIDEHEQLEKMVVKREAQANAPR